MASPAPTQHTILTDMLASEGDPRDLLPDQIRTLRTHYENPVVGPWHFAHDIFGFTDLKWDIHGPICWLIGHWGNPGYRRFMVRIPREYFKTSLCTRAGALWTLAAKDHDATIGIFNEKEENAESWIAAICQVVENSRLFQTLWYELIPRGIGYWDKEKGIGPPRKLKWGGTGVLFERSRHGISELSIEPQGIGGAQAGKHYTHKILDDIIGLAASRSVAVMQAAYEWVDNARALERPAHGGCELVAHTTWGYADVYEHMLEKWPGEYHVYHRALLEHPDTGEPDDVEGTSTFPEKIPTEQAYRMRDADPFVFCLPGNTRILMEDWSHRPIESLGTGDRIIGFETGGSASGKDTTLVPAVVKSITRRRAEVYEYDINDGTTLRCTPEHNWWNAGHRCYTALKKLQPHGRRRLWRVVRPADRTTLSDTEREAASYLAGLMDADGSVNISRHRKSGNLTVLCQHWSYQNIIERAKKCLDLLKFEYTEHRMDERQMSHIYIRGGRQERYLFMELCRPEKSEAIRRTLMGSHFDVRYVDGYQSLGIQTVYSIETTTGNYVAEGFLSKNSSQFQNQPKAGRSQSFDDQWVGAFRILETGSDLYIRIEDDHYKPGVFDLECGEDTAPQIVPLSHLDRALILDPAPSKENEIKRDPKARNGMVAVGIDPWGRYYCFEAKPSRDGPTEILDHIINLYRKWGGRIAIEEVVFSAVYAPLWTKIMELDPRYQDVRPEFTSVKPAGRNKDARIRDNLIPDMENGRWYFHTPRTAYLRKELTEFPFSPTKDLIDALSYTKEVVFRPDTPTEIKTHWQVHSRADRGLTGYGW